LLTKVRNGLTAWDIAAEKGNKEIVEKLWGWGTAVQVNVKFDPLIAKDFIGQTAWDIVAATGNKEILGKRCVVGVEMCK